MNNKTMGKDIANPIQREQFIKDNADACENKGYMKAYTPEELQGHKEKLANVSIEISEIENEIKEIKKEYAERLKPLKEARENMVSNIKAKAEYVNEVCYRFTDRDAKMTEYYNRDGDQSRDMRPAHSMCGKNCKIQNLRKPSRLQMKRWNLARKRTASLHQRP